MCVCVAVSHNEGRYLCIPDTALPFVNNHAPTAAFPHAANALISASSAVTPDVDAQQDVIPLPNILRGREDVTSNGSTVAIVRPRLASVGPLSSEAGPSLPEEVFVTRGGA